MGVEELRELLDLGAIEQVEASLRLGAAERRRAARSSPPRRPAARRGVRPRVRGDARPRAAGDPGSARRHGAACRGRGRGARPRRVRRDAARAACRTSSSSRSRTRLPPSLRRYARTHGPFTTAELAARFGLELAVVEAELRGLERDEKLVRGELRPGGTEREWCDPDVLRRIRRATLAVLRREVEPAEQAALGRFLPAWHGIGRRQTLREALVPLQALALPVSLWESDVLPRRVPALPPRRPRRALRLGRRGLGRSRARPRRGVLPRGRRRCSGRRPAEAPPEGAAHVAIRAALGEGALFWATSSPRPSSTRARRSPRSGISSGPAR